MIQCTRCGAIMEDSANFCGSCGGTEFVAATAGDGTMPNGGGMPQGNPAQGYQQLNYQQGAQMQGYQQPNYQQGAPVQGYQQPNYQQGAPAQGYQQPNYQQGVPVQGYQQPNYQQQGIPVPNYQPYPFAYQNVPPDLDRTAVSKSEFLKKYADPALRKEWRSIGIFFYIASGISILLSFIMASPLDVLFCLVLLGLVLGTHLAVNKVCAIILLVLSCLDTVLSIIAYGTPSGWLWILVGAMAITKIGKINTQYKQFQCGMPF